MGWYFSSIPRKPPKPTTANRILFDVLSSTMSSTLPIFSPAEFFTLLPMTRFARIAAVCPVAVGIVFSPWAREFGEPIYGRVVHPLHRRNPHAAVGACARGLYGFVTTTRFTKGS